MHDIEALNSQGIAVTGAIGLVAIFIMWMLHKRSRHQRELFLRAYYDELTELPNRRRLQAEWRSGEEPHALLVVGIERWQLLIATYGQSLADQLFRTMTRRLEGVLQASSAQSTLYMHCPGCWVISVVNASSMSGSALAQSIIKATHSPVNIGDRPVTAACNVGFALRQGKDDLDSLLQNAESALRDAITSDSHLSEFQAAMRDDAQSWLATEVGIRRGLALGEFELLYQLKVDARDHRWLGAEALLRWHRDGKLVSPKEFITVAEQSGLIVPLGNWVINEAARRWRTLSDAGIESGPIAVNVSVQHIHAEDFLEQLAQALKNSDVPGCALELEITEEAASRKPEALIQTLHAVKALGVSIAMDDFGTGYSSLRYLQGLPIDTLKLDQSFVKDIVSSSDDLAIATMIIKLAKALNCNGVAEGVENAAQANRLCRLGCDLLQGFYLSKPVSALVFEESLRSQLAARQKAGICTPSAPTGHIELIA